MCRTCNNTPDMHKSHLTPCPMDNLDIAIKDILISIAELTVRIENLESKVNHLDHQVNPPPPIDPIKDLCERIDKIEADSIFNKAINDAAFKQLFKKTSEKTTT